jgi:ankyrin repeat protein
MHRITRAKLHCTGSFSGKVTVVELLLEYGANPDVRDKLGWTPLHEAAFNLHLQVVVALLNHGADPHAQANDRMTLIQLANKRSGWWISRED